MNMIDDVMARLRIRVEQRNTVKVFLSIVIVIMVLYYLNFLPSFSKNHQLNDYVANHLPSSNVKSCVSKDKAHLMKSNTCSYRFKYPLSVPKIIENGLSYKIAIIADLDEERSKVPGKANMWRSYLRSGYLYKFNDGKYNIKWDRKVTITSRLNEKGRGFELSELCVFNSKLYTVDDRTGIVYMLHEEKAIPWAILQDGNGIDTKGFKGEWMTVKDGALYVGGLGKEWTTKDGQFVNYHPLFVKSISPNGVIAHHNWTENYLKIRSKAGVHFPGYMIHEAVSWSPVKRRWYFLPRRMSTLKYNDVDDERHGTNVMISCDADFNDIALIRVGNLEPTHGFSSFKFVPGTGDDVAIALKSREVDGNISSFIMIFNVETGHVLMPESQVDTEKYEGIEFI